MKIEIKERLIDRKWGWIKVYDIYSDGILVAIKDGGHYDCTAKETLSKSIDIDGDISFSGSRNCDFTCPFKMTDEIIKLCEEKIPLKTYIVRWADKTDGPFLTKEEAEASPLYELRWSKISQIIYSIK